MLGVYGQLGLCQLEAGGYVDADAAFEHVEVSERARATLAWSHRLLPSRAEAALLRGDLALATERYAKAERYAQQYDDREILAEVRCGQALLALLAADT